jgi:thioredoxin 1
MSDVIKVNEGNFADEVLGADGPVVVDFGAEWCGPCKRMEPILEEFASAVAGKAKVCSLDVDESRSTAAQYKVMSVPTMIFFKGGKEAARVIGLNTKEALMARLQDVSA